MTSTDHQGEDDFSCCARDSSTHRIVSWDESLTVYDDGAGAGKPAPRASDAFGRTHESVTIVGGYNNEPTGPTPPADVAQVVNAEVVLAALAQMEEVAGERGQLQSVKLSILRRRIASLQRQIENQAREVRPRGTDADAQAEQHSGYLQLHELVKDAPEGVRRAVTNDRQRVLANGSFALHPSMLRHLLVRAYEQGLRRGTVTDAESEIVIRWLRRFAAKGIVTINGKGGALEAAAKARNA